MTSLDRDPTRPVRIHCALTLGILSPVCSASAAQGGGGGGLPPGWLMSRQSIKTVDRESACLSHQITRGGPRWSPRGIQFGPLVLSS